MKNQTLILSAALAAILSLPALAAGPGEMQRDGMNMNSGPAKHMKMDGMDMTKKPTTAHGTGVVKAVDPKTGTITLIHGPIVELKWPAMTMSFPVADVQLLASVKPGDKVAFTGTVEGMTVRITTIQPAP